MFNRIFLITQRLLILLFVLLFFLFVLILVLTPIVNEKQELFKIALASATVMTVFVGLIL